MTAQAARGGPERTAPVVAYVVSRFPKVTETFIAREASAVAALGAEVGIWSLVRERTAVVHPEAAGFLAEARFGARGLRPWRAQLYWLRRAPLRYLATLAAVVVGNRKSLRFLLRGLIVFPIAAAWAIDMADRRVTVVHAHFATHATLAAYVVHRLSGIPYSFTAHAHDIYVNRTMLAEKARRAAAVVTISAYNARVLEKVVGPSTSKRVHIIRCGVDLTHFRPTQLGVPSATERPRVLCVAALEEKKGHRHLLTAVARLSQRDVELDLVLIGDGELRQQLVDQAAELGIEDRIRWRGHCSADEVLEALQTATCFVLPSVVDRRGRMEGIPVALMEAMAVGVPVVASDVSGVAELVRANETGWLVPSGDSEALAGAIAEVLDARHVRPRRVAARALIERDYDLRTNAALLSDLFHSVAAAPSGAMGRRSAE